MLDLEEASSGLCSCSGQWQSSPLAPLRTGSSPCLQQAAFKGVFLKTCFTPNIRGTKVMGRQTIPGEVVLYFNNNLLCKIKSKSAGAATLLALVLRPTGMS